MISVTIENTSKCGANCVMCPREQYIFPKANMEQALFEKIIRQIYEMDIRQVDIGGYGDPLMDPGLKEKIYFIKSEFPEMKITTITTGQLLCEDIADFIAENVDDLKISNYGMTKKIYEMVHRGNLKYELVHRNITCFLNRKRRPHVTMAYLILRQINESEIGMWKDYWQDKSDDIQIWYPHNYAGAKVEFDNILNYDRADVKTCGRPGNDFMFCANGDVTACCFDFNHKLKIGNMYNEDFNEIRKSLSLKEISRIHQHNLFENCGLICENCDQIRNRKDALYYSSNEEFKVGDKSQNVGSAGNEYIN